MAEPIVGRRLETALLKASSKPIAAPWECAVLIARSLLWSRAMRPTMDVGVDVGGTFTDFVGFRGREVETAKGPSTPDPSHAVVDGIREHPAGDKAHRTTAATKSVPQSKGGRSEFQMTAGIAEHTV